VAAKYTEFDKKVAIVTGGSAGIGEAVAEEFLKNGASVCFTGISERGLKTLEKWQNAGYKARFLMGDMADTDFCEKVVYETVNSFGRLDFLVNNAADFISKGLEATKSDWKRILEVNIIGYAMMVNFANAPMKETGGGAIVNISSVVAYVANPNRTTYCTTKAGIVEMTRCQAMDLVKYNIRVNSVTPGWIWTPIAYIEANGDRERWDPVWGRFHMMGRCGDPWEVAKPVIFLCSEDASFITGTDLSVDGGYLAMGPERMGEDSYSDAGPITENK